MVIRILFYCYYDYEDKETNNDIITSYSIFSLWKEYDYIFKWFPSYNNCISFATTSNVAAIFCCVMGNGDDKNHELLHYSRKSLFIGA